MTAEEIVLKNRGLKDVLNPKRWVMFFRSVRFNNKVKHSDRTFVDELKDEYEEIFSNDEYLEQVVLRMQEPGCRNCLNAEKCHHCGCKTPDLFFEKDMECSGGNWFPMVNKDQWTFFKAGTGLNVDQDYLEQIKTHGKIINFK